ncbi:MAG: TOBE domain-containing protein, partial [Pseudonocardiaceae bacterium]
QVPAPEMELAARRGSGSPTTDRVRPPRQAMTLLQAFSSYFGGFSRFTIGLPRICEVRSRPVSSFSIGEAAELLNVSADTVRRWVDAGQIPAARSQGGKRRVEAAGLARFLAERAPNTPSLPVAESARNHFPGLVTKVTKDTVMAQVEIQAGPYRVVSLMSREAADELKLAPGVMAVASVKSTNVVVEVLRT